MRVAARARQLIDRHSVLELSLRDSLLERRADLLSRKHPTRAHAAANTSRTLHPALPTDIPRQNESASEEQPKPNDRRALLGVTRRPLAVRSAERDLTEHMYRCEHVHVHLCCVRVNTVLYNTSITCTSAAWRD